MQQRPRDFQPPHLAAREVAHLAAGAIASPMRVSTSPLRRRASRRSCHAGRRDKQVLRHRQVEIERARLEHDAQQPQRLAGRETVSWPKMLMRRSEFRTAASPARTRCSCQRR